MAPFLFNTKPQALRCLVDAVGSSWVCVFFCSTDHTYTSQR